MHLLSTDVPGRLAGSYNATLGHNQVGKKASHMQHKNASGDQTPSSSSDEGNPHLSGSVPPCIFLHRKQQSKKKNIRCHARCLPWSVLWAAGPTASSRMASSGRSCLSALAQRLLFFYPLYMSCLVSSMIQPLLDDLPIPVTCPRLRETTCTPGWWAVSPVSPFALIRVSIQTFQLRTFNCLLAAFRSARQLQELYLLVRMHKPCIAGHLDRFERCVSIKFAISYLHKL